MQKLTALLLAAALALPMAACGNDQPPVDPVGSTAAPVETKAPESALVQKNGDLTLMAGETALFSVIRGEEAPTHEIKAALAFNAQIETIAGKKLTMATDFRKKDETADPAALEILIGATNRAESADLIAALPAMTFGIRTTDTKVVIAAADSANLPRAVDYFFANYAPTLDADGRLKLNTAIDYISEPYNVFAEQLRTADTFASDCERVFTVKAPNDIAKNPQGGTIHDGYFYQCFIRKDTASNEANNDVYLVKVDLATGEIVKTSDVLRLNHANDITYNTALNKLVVVHNNPNRTTVSVIDPETLTLDERKSVPTNIYCMDYNPGRDKYVIGLSGGQSFTTLTGELKIDGKLRGAKPTARTNGYTTQGMSTDDNFIYFVLYKQNVITVYDWDYNFVTLIELDVGGLEPENISVVGNDIYVTTTIQGGGGCAVWRVTPKAK